MTASGSSSVGNYEAGCPEIIYLRELLSDMAGVYSTRFSGGGFGGAVIALVDAEQAGSVGENVRHRYLDRYPDCTSLFRVEFLPSGPGAAWGMRV